MNWLKTASFLAVLAALFAFACACGDDDDDHDDADDDDDNDDNDDNDDATPPEEYDYDVPVKRTSPWPMYRRTSRNTGRSPIVPEDSGLEPWFFATGKGIFHEPVIDEDGTIYIGSADTWFYAINPDGTEKWRFTTGEINDSTAIIGADGTIYAPSGDGFIYALNPDGTEKWRFASQGLEGYLTWWEGHITMGVDGTLYAGNDDRHLYAINQDGTLAWTYAAGDQIWSCPSVGRDGELYFGSNDLMVRSVTADGKKRWRAMTLGPVASSTAIDESGDRVMVGSFDGYVHAYNAATGRAVWKVAARDHIYATPAIGVDGTIYVGSTDGTMVALSPEGKVRWSFDILDPIRSSAAIDGEGNVYFGAADGRLYCLNPDGTKRWSFDTATSDRNDLNGSPALGKTGVVIGGEAGNVVFVPYRYCETANDARCDTSPGEAIGANGAFLYTYTAGGDSRPSIEDRPAPTDVLTFRLVVRENGDTVRARIDADALEVTVTPTYAHRIEVSADGNFLSVIPEERLPMNAGYTIDIAGDYLVGGVRLGNKLIGGHTGGSFAGSFAFTTGAATGHDVPLAVTDTEATTLLMRRLAVPQPPMLTTFNQIGFDSYNFFLSVVDVDPATSRYIMLAVEGTPGLTPDIYAGTTTVFGLDGEYTDAYFDMSGDGFAMDVAGVSIVMDLFRISGLMAPDLTTEQLTAYAEVTCGNIEFFGFALNLLGLCHPQSGKLIANGTAMLAPPPGDQGRRPAGLAVVDFARVSGGGHYGGGYLEATFNDNELVAADELPVILVVDEAAFKVVNLNYGASLEKLAGAGGRLTGVKLHLPADFDPDGKKAYVLVNLYPLAERAVPSAAEF